MNYRVLIADSATAPLDLTAWRNVVAKTMEDAALAGARAAPDIGERLKALKVVWAFVALAREGTHCNGMPLVVHSYKLTVVSEEMGVAS